MKDPVPAIRTAFFNLLNGNVKFDISSTPVYITDAEETSDRLYVLISTITDTNLANKSAFFREMTVLIDCVQKTKAKQSRYDGVDKIASDVINLVLPSVNTTGLVDTDDFEFRNVQLESSQDLSIDQNQTDRIVRRLLRFILTVKQK